MPSPRTEVEPTAASRWARFDPRGPLAVLQRLNARLITTLATVALVGLVVSGLAINQILPGYFTEQTQELVATSAASTGILLRQEIIRFGGSELGRNTAEVQELRDTRIVPNVAAQAARIFSATVTIINADDEPVAQATPPESDVAALEAQRLRKDSAVGPIRARVEVDLPSGTSTHYFVVISDPFSTREETLERIQSALLAAGVLALAVSLVTGIVAARSLTVPIGRLRRVAGRVAQGQLDERAEPSGVLEVDELAAQFNVMADRLAGTLRMLEADRDRLREFVADVSHELRTPIAALRMYTELQADGKVDEATRREFLERSTEQIGRLEWLSTNLLDLSRIDAGIFPLDMRDGDLRDPVQAVVQALSEVAMERGVALDSVVPADPVELRFDRERIVQLLTNLIGNALKFTPSAGSVSIHLADSPDGAAIEVRDTGPGIVADELSRIFERFFRGTNTGQARASGSGLGLAIVRSIVDMHAGEIDVESVTGQGTAFRITLPRAPAADTIADEVKVNESSRGHVPARNPGSVP
ncbi:MAG: HAMP domain-containing histidine kinase [Chloroflexi bacterium]|nr:HAMP domain-containing histidine kinase [Chloroflexota bacterium]